MIRFGVKNLNEQLQKTLLNEGYQAGNNVPDYPRVPFTYEGPSATAVAQKITKYTTEPLITAASTATAVGCYNLSLKNKKLARKKLLVADWLGGYEIQTPRENDGSYDVIVPVAEIDPIIRENTI